MPTSPVLVTKIKVQLKLAVARLRMVQKRDETLAKSQRRSMAQLLDVGKVGSARIRVENIIRSDIINELHEILELYCELLLARVGLLEAPTCDPGLEEAIQSIIYAAPKTEVKELQQLRALFAEKFGKEFVIQAMDTSKSKVSEKVVKKLSVSPPKEELVQGYLEEIAKTYGANWPRRMNKDPGEPPLVHEKIDDKPGGGGQAQKSTEELLVADPDDEGNKTRDELSKATPPRSFGPGSPLHINPPSPSTDNIHPTVTLNSMEFKSNQKMIDAGLVNQEPDREPIGGVPDWDELTKRFAALKR